MNFKKFVAGVGASMIAFSGMAGVAYASDGETTEVTPSGEHSAQMVVANDPETLEWLNSQPLKPSLATAYAVPGQDGLFFCAVSNGHTSPAAIGGVGYGDPVPVDSFKGSTFDGKDNAKFTGTFDKGSEIYGAVAYLNAVADLPTNMTSKGLQAIKTAQEVMTGTLESGSANDAFYQGNRSLVEDIIKLAKDQRGPYQLVTKDGTVPEVETWVDGSKHISLPGFKVKTATGSDLNTGGVTKLIDPEFTGDGVPHIYGKVTLPKSVGTFENIPGQGGDAQVYEFSYTTGGEDEIDIAINANACQPGGDNTLKGVNVELSGLPASEVFISTPKENPDSNPEIFAKATSKAGAQPLFRLGMKGSVKMTIPACDTPPEEPPAPKQDNPELKTTLAFDDKGTKEIVLKDELTKPREAIDTVEYKNVPAGEYRLEGTLRLVSNPDTIVARSFVPLSVNETQSGTAKVTFSIPADVIMAGKDLVAYEKITRGGVDVASHEDPTDKNQTVKIRVEEPEPAANPFMKTTATDKHDGDKVIIAGVSKQVINDKIAYGDIPSGKYSLTTTAMLNGKTPIGTSTKEVTLTSENGKMEADVTLTKAIGNKDYVVIFEVLKGIDNPKFELKHENPDDLDQTVKATDYSMKTTATWENGAKEIEAGKDGVVVDEIEYKGYANGVEHTFKGQLVDYRSGDVVSEATVTHTPKAENGKVTVKFNVPAKYVFANAKYVVYETAYIGEEIVDKHIDKESKEQTVTVKEVKKIEKTPSMKTTAVWKGGAKVVEAGKDGIIVDTIDYMNYKVDTEHTFKGQVVDYATGKVIAEASTTHTPKSENGKATVEFNIPAKYVVANAKFVVYETAYIGDKVVDKHVDKESQTQTVTVNEKKQELKTPKMKTTAVNALTSKKIVPFYTEKVEVKDTIEYTDFPKAGEYEIRTWLMDKQTQEPVGYNTTKVTIKELSGKFDVKVVANKTLDPDHSYVVYEEAWQGETMIAFHRDINDEDQTVTTDKFNPEMKTTATWANGTKTLTVNDEEAKLNDVVDLKGLTTVGKKHKLVGEVVRVVDGKVTETVTTTSLEFTPEKADSQVTMPFTVSEASKTGKLVVFETLYLDGMDTPIIEHKDVNDTAQTVEITEESLAHTGASILGIGVLAMALTGAGAFLLRRRAS